MKASKNTVRIIGGQWRGSKITFPSIPGLRPTGIRIRETLFNWLIPHIHGANCLDLFAGSGALGLEALSRGARSVILLDQSPIVCQQLQQSLQKFNASNGTVLRTQANVWLQQPTIKPQTTHIVFIDPPFKYDAFNQLLAQLSASNVLTLNALIYLEISKDQKDHLNPPKNWQLSRHKCQGKVQYYLYQLKKVY